MKKVLFVVDLIDLNTWRISMEFLSKQGYSFDWYSVYSAGWKKIIKDKDYNLIAFMSFVFSIFLEYFILFLAEEKIKFIVTSKYEVETIKRLLSIDDLGCEDFFSYIKKPFDHSKLIELITEVWWRYSWV